MLTTSLSFRTLVLALGFALVAPSASQARDIKVHRDLDGDGHYNTKHIDVSHHNGYSHGDYGHG